MTRSTYSFNDLGDKEPRSLQAPRCKRDWRDRLARSMPPIFPTLMISLAVTAFFIEDYFLLEVFSVALCGVAGAMWLNKSRARHTWIANLFNKTSERITWMLYSLTAAFSVISPAFAGGGTGGCSATNTILGPIADALVGVFQSSAQVGTTGDVGANICQVFVTFAAIIALLVIGATLWGLFDNQIRGSDLGKAFAPLGLVIAGVVISRIGMKLVMGV